MAGERYSIIAEGQGGNKMITKADERFAMNTAKEGIQKAFTAQFGFAPSKKDICPMEYGASTYYGVYMIEKMAFCIKNIGWIYTEQGHVERAEQYDIA